MKELVAMLCVIVALSGCNSPRVSVAPSGASTQPSGSGLVMYVRNASGRTAWLELLRGGVVITSQGYDSPGAGCFPVMPGDRLILADRPPQASGEPSVKELLVYADAASPTTRWIDIADDGSITQGLGVPGWWAGDSIVC